MEGLLPVLALFHVPMSLKKAACGDIGPRSKSMSEESNTELGKPDVKGTAKLPIGVYRVCCVDLIEMAAMV